MRGFPLVGGPRNTSAFLQPTNLTSGGANAVGSYQQLLASAAQDIMGFWICSDVVVGTSNTDTGMLMNIAFGASGSEVIQVANVPFGAIDAQSSRYIPLHIPRGTEVRANIQAAVVNDIFDPLVIFEYAPKSGSFKGFTVGDVFGVNTAISGLTAGDLTDNAYETIIDPTVKPYRALTFHPTGVQATALQASLFDVEVGIGAAAAEQSKGHWAVQTTTTEIVSQLMGPAPLWCDIAEGSRISLRKNSANTLGGTVIGWA